MRSSYVVHTVPTPPARQLGIYNAQPTPYLSSTRKENPSYVTQITRIVLIPVFTHVSFTIAASWSRAVTYFYLRNLSPLVSGTRISSRASLYPFSIEVHLSSRNPRSNQLESSWYLLALFPGLRALLPRFCPRKLLFRSSAESWAGYER